MSSIMHYFVCALFWLANTSEARRAQTSIGVEEDPSRALQTLLFALQPVPGINAAPRSQAMQMPSANKYPRFESPVMADTGSVGLMKNDDGLEYVRLMHPDTGATSEIYLYGGVVTSYINDGVEYIAVRPDAKMDGSKPISGGLSHCWPQFGPGEIQQHGFARNVDWKVKEMSDTSVTLEMAPSDYSKEMWDKEFLCTFSVDLKSDQLTTKMLVENKGKDAFDFQAALHSYFACSSLENLEITGSFKGKEFLNKMVDGGVMQTEDRSAITIAEEYDRVYKGVADPALRDTGIGKQLSVVNDAGWEDTVVWSPYGNEAMGFDKFVCVESVKFDPVKLEGGSSWTGDMSLKPSDL